LRSYGYENPREASGCPAFLLLLTIPILIESDAAHKIMSTIRIRSMRD
jgi:hypothetical protein